VSNCRETGNIGNFKRILISQLYNLNRPLKLKWCLVLWGYIAETDAWSDAGLDQGREKEQIGIVGIMFARNFRNRQAQGVYIFN